MIMKDKVVIITGGNRGIGYGIAQAFFSENYKVVINFRSNVEATEKALAALKYDRVIAIKADINQKVERKRLLSETIAAFGRVDVLVNNAAVSTRYGFFKTNEEEYDRVYNANLKAPIFLSKIVAEQMIKQESGGSIINIASVAGHRPFCLIYEDSKTALLMATKNMAATCAKHAIRVNSITPGTHKTDLNRHNWEDDPKSWDEHCKESIPMGRAGSLRDLGAAAVFLASDRANYICGADIIIDGGFLTKR
jgi:galactitol 2-dehydrogenase